MKRIQAKDVIEKTPGQEYTTVKHGNVATSEFVLAIHRLRQHNDYLLLL